MYKLRYMKKLLLRVVSRNCQRNMVLQQQTKLNSAKQHIVCKTEELKNHTPISDIMMSELLSIPNEKLIAQHEQVQFKDKILGMVKDMEFNKYQIYNEDEKGINRKSSFQNKENQKNSELSLWLLNQ